MTAILLPKHSTLPIWKHESSALKNEVVSVRNKEYIISDDWLFNLGSVWCLTLLENKII